VYSALSRGTTPYLPALTLQYHDFAFSQRSFLDQNGVMAAKLDFWKTALAGAPPLMELPTTRNRPST
jgi:hypothetical protein